MQLIRKGMELNPHYSWDYPYNLGRAYYNLGEYEQAIEHLQVALERNMNAMPARLFLAASMVAVKQGEEAAWEVEQIMTMNPGISIAHIQLNTPIENPAIMKKYSSHLYQAGLPAD